MPAGYQRGPWRWPPVARVGENFERRKSGCDRWGPILPDVITAVAGVSDGTIGTATPPDAAALHERAEAKNVARASTAKVRRTTPSACNVGS